MTVAIDVGSGAIVRASGVGNEAYTGIDLNNPANFSGILTSVDIWAHVNMTGLRVGTFYLVSGTTYQCRASQAIGNVTAGSKQTFPVSIAVQAGDFIGFYYDTGDIRIDGSGGSGIVWKPGEYIDPGDSVAYALIANWLISIYGYTPPRGWCSK